MGCIRFGNNGYRYYTDGGRFLFSTDKEHNTLFEYIFTDISHLPLLFNNYISKRIDLTSFETYENKSDDDIIEIRESLKPLHPYYEYEWEKAIIQVLGKFFNRLLVYSVWTRKNLKQATASNKEWYMKKISALMPGFASHVEIYPNSFYRNYYFNEYSKYIQSDADEDSEIFILGQSNMPIAFFDEIFLQKTLYNALYFILDIDAYGLKSLTKEQRIWLFRNILFVGDKDPEISAKRKICFSRFDTYGEGMQNEPCNNSIKSSLHSFRGIEIGCGRIPSDIQSKLDSAIEYVKTITPDISDEEYDIFSLNDLLYLELEELIRSDTMVRRCKNCGKYFIINNKKTMYCDRPDKSGRICSEIGAAKAFQNKMNEEAALKIYNRAYKTHHARLKKGKMEKEELEKWRIDAKIKLEEVRRGEIDISVFEEWLKK